MHFCCSIFMCMLCVQRGARQPHRQLADEQDARALLLPTSAVAQEDAQPVGICGHGGECGRVPGRRLLARVPVAFSHEARAACVLRRGRRRRSAHIRPRRVPQALCHTQVARHGQGRMVMAPSLFFSLFYYYSCCLGLY